MKNLRIDYTDYIERIKLNRKVLYHFAIFAIVNEILVIKDC